MAVTLGIGKGAIDVKDDCAQGHDQSPPDNKNKD